MILWKWRKANWRSILSQACRGNTLDSGADLTVLGEDQVDSALNKHYEVRPCPLYKDSLIMYATPPGTSVLDCLWLSGKVVLTSIETGHSSCLCGLAKFYIVGCPSLHWNPNIPGMDNEQFWIQSGMSPLNKFSCQSVNLFTGIWMGSLIKSSWNLYSMRIRKRQSSSSDPFFQPFRTVISVF